MPSKIKGTADGTADRTLSQKSKGAGIILNHPSDGRTVITFRSGYHHYVDTGVCTSIRENKFFYIDGAVVRLIRFGSQLASTTTSRLYNVTITVDHGELWYLNISAEIAEFCGALTLLFNYGAYGKFISDYSKSKISPRGGKYIVDSQAAYGMKLIASDTPGHFYVSGDLVAYSIAQDGTAVYYSTENRLSLPQGFSTVLYARSPADIPLPEPPAGQKWYDCGDGIIALLPAEKRTVVYASQEAAPGGTGTPDAPFDNLEDAAAQFEGGVGTVRILGTMPFTTFSTRGKLITFEGGNETSELLFEKNNHYYLQSSVLFRNLRLSMPSSQKKAPTFAMLAANGNNLYYGKGLTSLGGIYSSGGDALKQSELVKINNVFLLSRNAGEPMKFDGCGLLFCISGMLIVAYQNQKFLLAGGNALLLPNGAECSIESSAGSKIRPSFLAVDFHLDGSIPKYRLYESIANSFFGDLIDAVSRSPKLLYDENWLMQLSAAVERILFINEARYSVARRMREYILENYAKITSVTQLETVFHLNRSYLERMYKKEYGVSLKHEITERRCEAAKSLLRKGYTVKAAANFVGYTNASSFSRAFQKSTGVLPDDFRHNVLH